MDECALENDDAATSGTRVSLSPVVFARPGRNARVIFAGTLSFVSVLFTNWIFSFFKQKRAFHAH